VGGQVVHHVGPPAKALAAARRDDLPSIVRSGVTPEALLGAAARDAEAGDDLVEDEQRARRVAHCRSGLEKSVGGGTTPMFPATGSTMIAASPSP